MNSATSAGEISLKKSTLASGQTFQKSLRRIVPVRCCGSGADQIQNNDKCDQN